MRPALAPPSYCSAATYLVLLKVIERAQASGALISMRNRSRPALQRDGEGVWGRWNANGPGTARLFYELGAGKNFTDWNEAKPGDFLKLFWRDAVGSNEFGHSVVYLGTETRGGVEFVRYWSSNKPDGFGEKSVAKSKVAARPFLAAGAAGAACFGGQPAARRCRISRACSERKSSFAEACKLSGVQ